MNGNSQTNSNDSSISRDNDKKNNKNENKKPSIWDCLKLIKAKGIEIAVVIAVIMIIFTISGCLLMCRESSLIKERYELASKLLKQAAGLADHKTTVILDLEGIHFEIRKTDEGLNNKREITKLTK